MPRQKQKGVPEGIKQMSECLDSLLGCGLGVISFLPSACN